MSDKKTIRVIKKGESTCTTSNVKADSAGEATRSLVGTVTNWVTEFQEKRHAETEDALRILSSDVTQKNLSARPEGALDSRAALKCHMSA